MVASERVLGSQHFLAMGTAMLLSLSVDPRFPTPSPEPGLTRAGGNASRQNERTSCTVANIKLTSSSKKKTQDSKPNLNNRKEMSEQLGEGLPGTAQAARTRYVSLSERFVSMYMYWTPPSL
jgi:hypothetical protein